MTLKNPSTRIEATVLMRGAELPAIGQERIRLLESVARHGSISAGARAAGLSYKAAWDALEAMSNLFGQPLLETRTGGRAGGGARLTATGLRVLESWHRLEAELARVLGALEPELRGTGVRPVHLLAGLLMRTSARNALRGTITSINSDEISADVEVSIGAEATIRALITTDSMRSLGLVPGRDVILLVKAPFIILAPGDEAPALSTANCLKGTVLRCEVSAVNAEVVLDIGDGRTLAATTTAESARRLRLAPGMAVSALFDAAHVILAID